MDVEDFDGYNKVYCDLFPKDAPARTTVGVAALNQGGRVELQMIAVRPYRVLDKLGSRGMAAVYRARALRARARTSR